MKQSEREIDELLTSLIVDVDEWEGGLLCTPENRKIVGEWLTKQRLTKRVLDVPCTCPRFENGSKVFPMRECEGCRKSAHQ